MKLKGKVQAQIVHSARQVGFMLEKARKRSIRAHEDCCTSFLKSNFRVLAVLLHRQKFLFEEQHDLVPKE